MPNTGPEAASEVETVERVIPASPERIFDLLADPTRHPEIDGSGTVQKAKGPSERLRLGSSFGMSMRLGIPYSMVSTVIEFEENRRIAWQTKVPGLAGHFIGGRIWRYVLEPAAGGTRVQESWDISRDRQRLLFKVGPMAEQTRADMAATLDRIAEVVGAP